VVIDLGVSGILTIDRGVPAANNLNVAQYSDMEILCVDATGGANVWAVVGNY